MKPSEVKVEFSSKAVRRTKSDELPKKKTLKSHGSLSRLCINIWFVGIIILKKGFIDVIILICSFEGTFSTKYYSSIAQW